MMKYYVHKELYVYHSLRLLFQVTQRFAWLLMYCQRNTMHTSQYEQKTCCMNMDMLC